MGTSQIGQSEYQNVLDQRDALGWLIDHPPRQWAGKTRRQRFLLAQHYLSRIKVGETFSIELRPAMPAVLELRFVYGLTASGAAAVLRKHKAPRQGRGFAPLTPELRDAIRDKRRLAAARKLAAERRMAETGCTREAAVRWAHRHERTVERRGLPADARIVEGQARTIDDLAALFPDRVRTHTRTHNGGSTGGVQRTTADTD